MKSRIIACAAAAVIFLSGASIWEGVAEMSSGDLPREGFYAATNSFPKNTVVDITNLENGKSVRVIVASGLDTPGLLAVVSAEAAEMIGLQSHSNGRIRMSQPSDPVAFSRFIEGFAAEFPDYDSTVAIEQPEENDAPPVPSEERLPVIAGIPEEYDYRLVPSEQHPPAIANIPEENDAPPVPSGERLPVIAGIPEEYDYRLVPSEQRPPVVSGIYDIDPESIISGINNYDYYTIPDNYGDYYIIPDIPDKSREMLDSAENVNPLSSPFSVPMISGMERGSYYVQLAAFSRAELVESEISRIDRHYPVTVLNSGSGSGPVYRILLGPLNLGESGAVLQRFKTIGYKDAFIREG